MSERKIEILHEEFRYFIHPLSEQSIRDGLVRSVRAANGIDYIFGVEKDKRDELTAVIREIEDYFENPHLAITAERKMRWMGVIESTLKPPVEVVGPTELLW